MKIHLTTGGTKRYRDSQTGQEYRFDWEKFTDAALCAEGGINKAAARLAEDAHISEAAVNSHLRDRRWSSIMRFPEDINIIRSYGMTLAGDENAFLHPVAPAERPSPKAVAELKRRGERERAALAHGLTHRGGYPEKTTWRQVILETFTALWEILSLYEISDGYNLRPDTSGMEGAEEYFDTLLSDVRETLLNVRDILRGKAHEPIRTDIRNESGGYTFWGLDEILRDIKIILWSEKENGKLCTCQHRGNQCNEKESSSWRLFEQ